MSSAGVSFYAYGAQKAWVARQLTDTPGVLTGPTYGPAREWDGFQKIQQATNREPSKLIGGGQVIGTESELDGVPVTCEVALTAPSVESVLMGTSAWATEDGMTSAVTASAGNQYCGLWVLTNKVGTNGKQLVQFFPRIKFGSLTKNIDSRAFRTNQLAAECAFSKSKFEVWTDGVKSYEQVAVLEYYQDAADVFPVTDTSAPVLTSSAALTAQPLNSTFVPVMSDLLDPDSVNNYTVLFKKAGVLLDAEVAIIKTGSDAYKSFSVNPAVNLTASATDYTIEITTQVMNQAGINVATTIVITIAAASS